MSLSRTQRFTASGQEVKAGVVEHSEQHPLAVSYEAAYATVSPDTFVGRVRILGRLVAESEPVPSTAKAISEAKRISGEAFERLFAGT